MNLARFVRVMGFLESEYDPDDDTTLRTRIVQAKTYVDNRLCRAELVTALPPDAPAGYLMVKAGDINLYIGAGTGNPLRRIPTQALP